MNTLWSNIFSLRKKTSNDPKRILGEIPIFHKLKPAELKEIERIVHVREYSAGEYIFREGDVGAGLFVIAEGNVEILVEQSDDESASNRLAVLGKSDFFGELSLLDDERRSASCKATEPSVLIGLFRPDLLDLIERNPRLGSKVLMNIALVIGERLRVTVGRISGDIPDKAAGFAPAEAEKAEKDDA